MHERQSDHCQTEDLEHHSSGQCGAGSGDASRSQRHLLGEDIADAEEGGVVGATKGLSTKFGTKRVRTTLSKRSRVGRVPRNRPAVAKSRVVARAVQLAELSHRRVD